MMMWFFKKTQIGQFTGEDTKHCKWSTYKHHHHQEEEEEFYSSRPNDVSPFVSVGQWRYTAWGTGEEYQGKSVWSPMDEGEDHSAVILQAAPEGRKQQSTSSLVVEDKMASSCLLSAVVLDGSVMGVKPLPSSPSPPPPPPQRLLRTNIALL